MSRFALALTLTLALLAAAGPSAHADGTDIQTSGPEQFPGKHELAAHLGGQVGLSGFSYGGGTPGGFKLMLEYGYRLTDLWWLNAGVNLVVAGGCSPATCAYVGTGNTVEPQVGIKVKFKTQIPLVAYAKADAAIIGIYNRYCTNNGFALGGRVGGGANYYLLKNLGVGVEAAFTVGPAFLGSATAEQCGVIAPTTATSHIELYAAIDFTLGAEFLF